MSTKISVILPVYNEELLLPLMLDGIIQSVDEIIIVDSSPWGPSTDETAQIVNRYVHTGKIKYFAETLKVDEGVWDEAKAWNLAIENVTGEWIMPMAADIIHTREGMATLKGIITDRPDVQILNYFMLEFFWNMCHFRLYTHERFFKTPIVGADIPMVRTDGELKWNSQSGLNASSHVEFLDTDRIHFVPSVYRYHYGWLKPYRDQVQKHVRNMRIGAWGDANESLRTGSDKAVYRWACQHVDNYLNCPHTPRVIPLPLTLPRCDSHPHEGREEYLTELRQRFGEDFYV
jgi:glycosyltransferase involved in cell wall biosynthesis